MAVRVIRRPRAKTSASIAPCAWSQADAEISFHNRRFKVGKAFIGLPVALRPTLTDGVFHLLFAHSVIRTIDLRSPLPHV